MSRFWTSYTSIRGKTYGAPAPAGGLMHTRGWAAGVSVTPCDRNGRAEFDVAMTTGSRQQGGSVPLGTVQDTPSGPRWVPAPARTHEDIDRIAFGTDAGSSDQSEDQADSEPRPAGFRMDDAEALVITAGELWTALDREDPTGGNLSELQVNLLEQAADRNDDAMGGSGS